MKISSVTSFNNNLVSRTAQKEKSQSQVSFKSIFVESIAELGHTKAGSFPAKFAMKDSLLLNDIAKLYPNQDCFIKRGLGGFPCLEYREKPPEVQTFNPTVFGNYNTTMNPNDKNYAVEPLILYPDEPEYKDKHPEMTLMIGVPSYISTNPSLAYTVKAGYEVHKKLLEKKYQIMSVVGKNDSIDLGGKSVTEKAHEAVNELEIAVTRHLLECAYAALKDRASAAQIYSSIYPKIQARLEAERKLDITTSLPQQTKLKRDKDIQQISRIAANFATANNSATDETEDSKAERISSEIEQQFKSNKADIDICEQAMLYYPNLEENKHRIDELMQYMNEKGITLFDSADLI